MTTPTKLNAKKRKEVTVKTVIELSSKQNPSDITTSAIANEMGLTQGALFRHFPTKESIFEAVIAWISKKLLNSAKKKSMEAKDPLDAIKNIFNLHVDIVVKHPGVPRLLFGELQQEKDSLTKKAAKVLMSEYSKLLIKIFKQGKERGFFKSNLDEELAAFLFIGLIQGLVVSSLLNGSVKEIEKRALPALEIFLEGISCEKIIP
ncbi:MAG: TetR/AcrR family transcriptional regulator [Sulfurospirillaceae bacterium]|jgi:AcrR family transcriptional regulator|nr:TetR/AcrR family transcriptional regulator [Sulfurospirillaceae bacterium]MCK9546318.1 TetR/AcrR family transcriptional regulator [Sulfurospirillaceae bacterium]MDY0237947.1 TetR/AcrR family transcriptional regulator [Campylobacterales bacterium]